MNVPTEFVEARPMYGYLIHAVTVRPVLWHRPTPWMLTTYQRALCGVGKGGMRIEVTPATRSPKPWRGIDGCERCAGKVKKIQERERSENQS